ncbi:IS110 family transposase [Streptomyces sp. NPDC048419]|uniref:IS110 family transposase n=1 Tax=Streptomyces sp. NPDC048419 TaxID=3365547 RepID=UPI00371DD282
MSSTAGYDIAKEFHWLAALDDRGRPLLSHRVDNTPEAIEHSISELHIIEAEHGPVTIGLDILGGIAGLLAAMLLAEGFTCVHVPGLAVNRARRATRGGENKSDPRDAKVIAEQVMLRDDLRIVELPEETAVELRLLVAHRTTLVKDATARTARLRDLLTGIHPGLERAVDHSKVRPDPARPLRHPGRDPPRRDRTHRRLPAPTRSQPAHGADPGRGRAHDGRRPAHHRGGRAAHRDAHP